MKKLNNKQYYNLNLVNRCKLTFCPFTPWLLRLRYIHDFEKGRLFTSEPEDRSNRNNVSARELEERADDALVSMYRTRQVIENNRHNFDNDTTRLNDITREISNGHTPLQSQVSHMIKETVQNQEQANEYSTSGPPIHQRNSRVYDVTLNSDRLDSDVANMRATVSISDKIVDAVKSSSEINPSENDMKQIEQLQKNLHSVASETHDLVIDQQINFDAYDRVINDIERCGLVEELEIDTTVGSSEEDSDASSEENSDASSENSNPGIDTSQGNDQHRHTDIPENTNPDVDMSDVSNPPSPTDNPDVDMSDVSDPPSHTGNPDVDMSDVSNPPSPTGNPDVDMSDTNNQPSPTDNPDVDMSDTNNQPSPSHQPQNTGNDQH